MTDDRHVRLEFGWLVGRPKPIVHQGSLIVLVVAPADSPSSRLENLRDACRQASRMAPERLLPLMAHDVDPVRLPSVLAERVHLGIVILADDSHVLVTARLMAEAVIPRLLLITPATVRVLGALGGDGAELVAARHVDEARGCCEHFLRRGAANGDGHRHSRPLLGAGGLTATRQRALRAWEALPDNRQEVVAACNGHTADEVEALLHDRQPVGSDAAILIAQLDVDLRQAMADLERATNGHQMLDEVEFAAFREYCTRSRIPLGGAVARRLLNAGEGVVRQRRQREAVGAEARRSLRHWTQWAKLYDTL